MSGDTREVDVSVVIPVLNEREALAGVLAEVEDACSGAGWSFEVIVIDDGSTDGSLDLVASLASERPWLRGVGLRRNFGKSAALAAGFAQTEGDVVVTIDGDGQDDPADIPALVEKLGEGLDIVSGWKRERRDPLSRRLASRFFNRVTSRFSGVRMHDANCGLKAYRGECARSLELYGELHRFIPMLATQQGWQVGELPVNHRPRPHGRSRFGTERYLRGALDLLTVAFLGRYQYRPLHLFGGIGVVLTLIGLGVSAYLTVVKISGEAIGQRPLLFLGILLIVVGVQFLSLGLLGQMLVQIRRERAGPARTPPIQRIVGAGHGRSATETTTGSRAARATAEAGDRGSSGSTG